MQRREELNCCLFPFIEKHIRFETKFLMKGEYIMKSKIDMTKLYEGIIGLSKVMIGHKCNSPEYLEVKKDFRYPGELLERMEEKGYSSINDYISVMCGLKRSRKYFTKESFVGEQLENFLVRAKKKAVDNNCLLLMYQVMFFSKEEGNVPKISESDLELLLKAAEKNDLESLVFFLYALADFTDTYWERHTISLSMVRDIMNTGAHYTEFRTLQKRDILNEPDLFMSLIHLSVKLFLRAGQNEKDFKIQFGDPDLADVILAFADMYKEPLKKKYQKILINKGFSESDILSLNCGIWQIRHEKTELTWDSKVKWWRLVKRWFQCLFQQEKEITIKTELEHLIQAELPQKIDGETSMREFLFKGLYASIPNLQNSYLLFHLLTMKDDNKSIYSKYTNYVPEWKMHCTNHPLDLDTEEHKEWLEGLMKYLLPNIYKKEEIRFTYWPNLADLYVQVLRLYMKEELLKKMEPSLKEVFSVDVKDFLYSHPFDFNSEDIKKLLETGYLSINELYKQNKGSVQKYINEMDHGFILDFVKDFCESRNWSFTPDEAKFLKVSFTSSWPVSLAYYKQNMETHFEAFTDEQKENLMGLLCEICIHIPEICDLESLMAGFIANSETRKILGEELAESWYKLLAERKYVGMDYLNKAYLSEEQLKKLQKEEEEERRKEEEEKFRNRVEKQKEMLLDKINLLPDSEKFVAFLEELPYGVYSHNSVEAKAVLEIYGEKFINVDVSANKKLACKSYSFFVECYKYGLITKDDMVQYITNFKEEPENE